MGEINKDSTVNELKGYLEHKEIEYPTNAKKSELLALAGVEQEEEEAPSGKKHVGGKNRFSKKELEAMAPDYFKRLKVAVLFACQDGQFFFKMNDARQHAKKQGLEAPIQCNK